MTNGMLPIQGQAKGFLLELTVGTKALPIRIQSRQVPILQDFASTFGIKQRSDALSHSLAGGGSYNLGFHALRWEMILHGNAGEMGKYAVLSTLLDKNACFLYEYHNTSYTSLGLPAIPLDRSNIKVHGILRPDQVQ